jgi:ABC-type sugar transport system substrate-binding protein
MAMMNLFLSLAQQRWLAKLVLLLGLLCSSSAYARFIAVSVSAEDNFRNMITSNIEKAVDEVGDEVYIDAAGGDFETQVTHVKNFVAAGADAIIILSAGSPEQNVRLFEYAKKVPLIFVNVEPLKNLKEMPANTVYVGSNEEQSGTMQMEELARLAAFKGKVALLMGEENHPAAQMRTLDVKNVLAKYPELSLVESKTGNWQRNQAYKIVSDWIKNKVDFNILVANNDEMIIGGVMAIKDAGLDPKKFFTGGIDATPDALQEMAQGNLNVSVLQDAAGQARSAVDAAYLLINKKPVVSPYWVPFRLVTTENYAEFLKK